MSNEKNEDLNEVLDISQRVKRAMITKKNQNKLKIARKVAQRKKAPQNIIRKRAFHAARKIVRRRIAGKMGAEYENLSPTQKINIDKMLAGKQAAIKKLALRLIPRIEQLESKRLQSFLHGKQLENLGKKEMKEEALNEKFQNLLTSRKEERVKEASDKKNQFIKFFKKFSDVIKEDSPVYKALQKKAEKSGIPNYVLGEVFLRGIETWNESFSVSKEQYAFARVNSYINRGKTYFNEDKDMHEWENETILEISQKVLKNYAMKAQGQAKNPGYNKEYHAKIKSEYGNDDPEVKQYNKFEKKHQNRVAGVAKATQKLGGFDHQKEVEDHVAKSKAMTDKYGSKLQNTPAGSGYVVGHDPNKKDHAIVRIDHSTGTRSKNKQDLKDHSVHIKHLKESDDINEWIKFDRFGKRITNITSPCGKGYRQKGVIVVDGKEVPHCVKIGAKTNVTEGKMKELDSDLRDMDNGNFKKKYGKDKNSVGRSLNFKERIDEARQPSAALKRAQANLADAREGFPKRKAAEAHAKAMTKGRADAHKNLIKYSKEDADHHRKMHDHYHAKYKEHDEVYNEIEKHPGNFGLSPESHRGALEEVDSKRDRAAEKRYHHERKFYQAKNEYEERSGKEYKHKLAEETLDEMRLNPADREVGTDSSVANYKEDTPGQGKDKTHDKCGTPDCCGKCSMKEGTIEGVPVVHTNSADVKHVKVTTPTGKVVWRKERKTRDIIK